MLREKYKRSKKKMPRNAAKFTETQIALKLFIFIILPQKWLQLGKYQRKIFRQS